MKTRIFYSTLFFLVSLFSSNLKAQIDIVSVYGDAQDNVFNYVNFDANTQTYFAVGETNDRASFTRIAIDGELMWTKLFAEPDSEFTNYQSWFRNREMRR